MSRIAFETIKTTTAAAIATGAGTYVVCGSVTAQAWRIVCFNNNTDADMFFSIDGTNDQVFVPMSGFKLFDLSTNAVNVHNSDGLDVAIKTQFYVRYISGAPTTGNVYIEGPYSPGSN